MDFESTCWKDGKYRTQEIIEFPAVLLNTSSGQIEAEFQYYVQPQENPVLSDFCTELTGISQDQVEQGISLSVCLKKFCAWLKSLSESHGFVYDHTDTDPHRKQCTFVTWSDWDLAVCLHYETQRKQLRKPSQLNSWIDLRATYRTFYDRKPKGLNGALQDLGIAFEGREHSGLHDSRNTAQLAWKMICDGCILKVTKSLTPALCSRLSSGKTRRSGNSGQLQERSSPVSPKRTEENSSCMGSRDTKVQTDGSSENETTTATKNKLKRNFSIFEDKTGSAKMSRVTNSGSREAFRDITNVNVSTMERFKTPGSVVPKTGNQAIEKKQGGSMKKFTFKTPSSIPKPMKSTDSNIRGKNISSSSMTTPNLRPNQTVNSSNINSTRQFVNHSMNSSENTSGIGMSRIHGTTGSDCSNYQGSTGQKLKKTPPMCECGRRTVRKFVQNPGPNMGRVFFCCPQGRNSSHGPKGFGKLKQGCGFFKWEVETSASPFSFTTTPVGTLSTSSNSTLSSCVGNTYKRETKSSFSALPQPNFNTPNENTRTMSSIKSSQKKTLGIQKTH